MLSSSDNQADGFIEALNLRYLVDLLYIDNPYYTSPPPQTLFVEGILFSRCTSVRASVRP